MNENDRKLVEKYIENLRNEYHEKYPNASIHAMYHDDKRLVFVEIWNKDTIIPMTFDYDKVIRYMRTQNE